MDVINEIEATFPVDRWKIENIHVWPFLRFDLTYQLALTNLSLEALKAPPQEASHQRVRKLVNWAGNIRKYWEVRFGDRAHNEKELRKVDAAFLTYSLDRTRIDGSYYNKPCDSLIELLELRGVKSYLLESIKTEENRIPRRSPSKIIQPALDRIDILTFLERRLFKFRVNLDRYVEFLQFVERMGVNSKLFDPAYVVHMGVWIHKAAQYFEDILRTLDPRIAFVTDYGTTEGRAFVHACRKRGLLVVDLQHGVAGEFHPSYGRFTKFPQEGYLDMPNYFWCWSQTDVLAIKTWAGLNSHRSVPILGGNLWLQRWARRDSLGEADAKRVREIKEKHPNRIQALYTLQYDPPPEWILHAIKDTSTRFFWWFRLHPSRTNRMSELLDFMKKYQIEHFNLLEATEAPLPILLQSMDVHVTATSTSIIESEIFEVPSIAIDRASEQYFFRQISSGAVKTAYNQGQFEEILKILAPKAKKQPQWERSSDLLCEKAIDQLLDQAGLG